MKKTLLFLLIMISNWGFAQSNHTVNFTGSSGDFYSTEKYSAVGNGQNTDYYITFDGSYLYIGAFRTNGSTFGTTDNLAIYIDTDPNGTPTSGTGISTGQTYNGVSGSLPFTANYNVHAEQGYQEARSYNSTWASTISGVTYTTNSTCREVKIPFSSIGSPNSIYLTMWMGYGGGIYANAPGSNISAVSNPTITNYFGGIGLSSADCIPINTTNTPITDVITNSAPVSGATYGKVTISTGTTTATNNFTIAPGGSINVTGGTFDISGRTITMGGSSVASGIGTTLNVNGGTLTTTNATHFIFSGEGNITGSALSLNAYTVINRKFTPLASGATTFANGSVLDLRGGSYINTNAPTYTSGSTLKYNSGTTYGVSTEWASGATSGTGVPANVVIGDSVASSGLTFNALTTYRQANGDVTISNNTLGSSLTLSTAVGGDLYLTGNFNQNGTFNHNNRALFFVATSGTQTITGTSSVIIPYLVFGGTGSRTVKLSGIDLNASATNGGNAIAFGSSGNDILDLNGRTLSLGTAGQSCSILGTGKFRGSTSSNISINGTGTLGTLYFDQTTPGTTNALNNLSINLTSSGSVTLGNALNLSGVLTPTAGVLTTGGFLTLTSTTITGGGAIGQGSTSGGYISGNVTIQRYTQAQRGYRTIANPFNSAQALSQLTNTIRITGLSASNGTYGVTAGNPSAFYYDPTQLAGTSSVLQPITSATDATHWPVGSALYVFVRGPGTQGSTGPGSSNYGGTISPVTLNMSGATINQGNLTAFGLTYGGIGKDNYNLIGNPYPCPVNLKGITTSNTSSTVYVYNPVKNIGIGNQFSVSGGFDSYTNDGSTDIIIPSLGGFYIQTTGASPSITFKESNKITTTTPNVTVFGGGTPTPSIRLTITTVNGNVDDLKIGFDANSTALANDIYDAPKLSNSLFDFYSLSSDNKRLTIDYRSATNIDSIIPLGITTNVAGTYSINLNELSSLPNTQVVLRDKLLKTETPLSQVGDSYSFTITADTATKGDNRFEIGLLSTTVLPVTITDITAKLQTNKTVAVNWTSATEVNLANYNIQRSLDGTNFSTIGKVAAKGAGAYNYIDDLSSIYSQAATLYYRLEAVDNNGSKSYSKVVNCQLLATSTAINIYPNPVQSILHAQITATNAGSAKIRVIDAQGKVVVTQKTAVAIGTNSIAVPVASLTAGNYVLEIESSNGKQQQRFVKE